MSNFGNCYECQESGHVAAECPNRRRAGDTERPTWCRGCDPKTRLVDMGHKMARCPACHPLRWQPLAQHKVCGGCGLTVYDWDNLPCKSEEHPGHQPVGVDLTVIEGKPAGRPHEDWGMMAEARRQVEEFRQLGIGAPIAESSVMVRGDEVQEGALNEGEDRYERAEYPAAG